MASNSSVNSPLSPALGWLVLVGGVGVALGWVLLAQHLGDTIAIPQVGAAMTVYYAMLFLPLIALALALGAVERRKAWRLGAAPARWAGLGAGLGLAGLATTVLFAALNGGLVKGPGGGAGLGILLGLGLMLVQVLAEELLFRGWLQPSLITRCGPVAGVLLGAVCFAAFHLTGGVRAPLSLVNVALAGTWFGLLALRSGGLVASLAAHVVWNAVEDLGLGLVPNPGSGALGSLVDLDLTGLPLWGGQEEGLNASLGTTLVLLALILPLLRAPGRVAAPAH